MYLNNVFHLYTVSKSMQAEGLQHQGPAISLQAGMQQRTKLSSTYNDLDEFMTACGLPKPSQARGEHPA